MHTDPDGFCSRSYSNDSPVVLGVLRPPGNQPFHSWPKGHRLFACAIKTSKEVLWHGPHSLQLSLTPSLTLLPFRSFLHPVHRTLLISRAGSRITILRTISMLSLLSSRAVVMITLASFAIRGSFAAVAAIPGTKCAVSSAVLSLPATAAAGNGMFRAI